MPIGEIDTTKFGDAVRNIQRQMRVIGSAEELLKQVKANAATFRRYEILHLEKGTADGDEKARANGKLAIQNERLVVWIEGGSRAEG